MARLSKNIKADSVKKVTGLRISVIGSNNKGCQGLTCLLIYLICFLFKQCGIGYYNDQVLTYFTLCVFHIRGLWDYEINICRDSTLLLNKLIVQCSHKNGK
jgi:hypothetical protein